MDAANGGTVSQLTQPWGSIPPRFISNRRPGSGGAQRLDLQHRVLELHCIGVRRCELGTSTQ